MTTIALALVLTPEVLPFGSTVSLPPGSVKSYVVTATDPNKGKVSDFQFFFGEPVIPQGAKWGQALCNSEKGWHDGISPIVNGKVKLDPLQSLMAPVYDYSQKRFLPAYWRFWTADPYGVYKDLVWGRAALTLKASGCTVFVRIEGSPWQSLDVYGNDNDVTAQIRSGVQSRLILDLSAARFTGRRNTLRGDIHGFMGGAFFDGPDNRSLDLTVTVKGVGDDVGGITVRRASDGFRGTNTTSVMDEVLYPSIHGRRAFMVDDKSSYAVLFNCTALGEWTVGAWFHGGSNNRVERFRSFGPKKAVVFDPHFTTPTLQPTGNLSRSITEAK